jgi:erythromycin esterase-like protein
MPSTTTPSISIPANVIEAIDRTAHPLTGESSDYDPLLQLIGDARLVLLGEASHGTHEFYEARAAITQRLIAEKGFHAIAVEADWPDAYRVNRYVADQGADRTALEALGGFQRFPTWMWCNIEVLAFVDWLHAYNHELGAGATAVGFYGLDLYSLQASIRSVLRYLDQVDPLAAARARSRYACFDHFGEDTQRYGYAANFGLTRSCENEVVEQLVDLQVRAPAYARHAGFVAQDEFFFAEQNARLVKNAEAYYRSMFRDRVSSWNLRDGHMAETLEALAQHLERQRKAPAKIVVWAHNSHLGDARATQMADAGEWNVGQLVRERSGAEASSIGFTTHHGTVTAASDWDAPAERKRVRPALEGSFEALFHQLEVPRFMLNVRADAVRDHLRLPRLERAIGVIYRPESERVSHYFTARLSDQFDAVLHFDETRAVEPLERNPQWDTGEVPETYPTGM